MARVLEIEYPNSPYLNLAFEEAIPLSVGRGESPETLRFWRNDRTVVIGLFQCPSLEVNFEECLKYGVRVVRRFTGGGAVYHDLGNLNFALSLKRDNPIIRERLLKGFEILGKAVEIGLKKLGVTDASFEPINSVLIGKNKVVGMAGLITKNFIFVHGSMLINSNTRVLERVLKASNGESKERFVRSKRQEVVALKEVLNSELELSVVKKAIIEGLERVLGLEFGEDVVTNHEKRLAERLYVEKYSRIDWSMGPCNSCLRKELDKEIFMRLTFEREDEGGYCGLIK